MNKSEFMDTIRRDLAPLTEQERNELLARCEDCFRVGLQQGRTEEEIAAELGYSGTAAEQGRDQPLADWPHPGLQQRIPLPPPPRIAPVAKKTNPPDRDVPRILGVAVLLFFLNALLAIPIFAALGSSFIAVCAAAFATLLSPLALIAETTLYGDFTNAKLMLSLGMVGIGMILADLALLFGKGLFIATKKYAGWNYRTLKGRTHS